ncbi:glycoside hydrolase family 2 [Aerococcaceae bacterium WS4759]|uniref:Glycoside hydrolase family 2 n=1 Tax=Fundicoccus ignavus TaxID=2664442 RepID=A0A6I2GGG4_9LACT|nr:glycoside hydrolase family 2 [Fundicoccus ignavus]
MEQLYTKWGRKLNAAKPLPEYPRPQMKRKSYFNLNGEWDFELSHFPTTDTYSKKITVPFAPETALSGIQQPVLPEHYMHYRKQFTLPDNFVRDRVLLHFGAVDQECVVLVNDQYVGEHIGGYLNFSFDITDYLNDTTNTVAILAKDFTEYQPHARGKQKLKPKGKMKSLFYTPTSGIWQTVWLESVTEHYITQLDLKPKYNDNSLTLTVHTNSDFSQQARVIIQDRDGHRQSVPIHTNRPQRIALDYLKPWTPADPHLYTVTVVYRADVVDSYFAMRDLSVVTDKQGVRRFALNHEPIFLSGVLDQGYWPDGGLTAPADAALVHDIAELKAMGFNTIRKHVKIESARFYYHCDRLGMLVVQDMPNGGAQDYPMWLVTYAANASDFLSRKLKDDKYKLFGREDEAGRAQYYQDLAGMMKQLAHFPSIAAWVPFNEGWGQFDAAQVGKSVKEADPTRWLIETSGWFDQHGGDTYSIHNYLFKLKVKPQDRVVALTEYGGYAYAVDGHVASDKEFGYQHYKSAAALTANYERLWKEDILPNIANGLSMAIYTQVSDVEQEINGIFTYDREVQKLDPETVKRLNDKAQTHFEQIAKIR